jgi:L-lysine exporter family protein LysE/ArgO
MLLPLLFGFLIGVLLCFTFGTVFFSLIQNSVDNGYKAGLIITAGVVVGDAIYVTFALLGTSMIPHSAELEPVLAFIGVLFLLVLGILNLVRGTPRIAYPKTKFGNYAYYFTTGFLLNALNPINFVSWVAIATGLRKTLGYAMNQQVVFMVFALVGVATAESGIAIYADRLKQFFTPKVALLFNRVTGFVFIGTALHLAWVKLYEPLMGLLARW